MNNRLAASVIFWLLLLAGEIVALRFYGGIFVSHVDHSPFVMPSDLACFRMNAALAQAYKVPPATASAASCAYMYPPPFFLLTAPLAWLSPKWAYALWSVAGILLLSFAGRVAKYPWPAIGLGLVSPPSLYCLMAGQTGEIMSGLLLLSLALAETNPVLAGIAAGCVGVKPQFALLLPICFLAARKWPVVITAAATATVICLLSTVFFGFDSWRQFVVAGLPAMHAKLDTPWPEPSQSIMISIFMMMRSLGAGLNSAFAVQTAVTLGAIAAAWTVWRPQTRIDRPTRLLLTLCLVPLATPYGYIYDIPGLAMALAAAFVNDHRQYLAPMAMFWFITGFYILIAIIGFVAGGILLALLAIGVWSWSTKRPAAALPAEG